MKPNAKVQRVDLWVLVKKCCHRCGGNGPLSAVRGEDSEGSKQQAALTQLFRAPPFVMCHPHTHIYVYSSSQTGHCTLCSRVGSFT